MFSRINFEALNKKMEDESRVLRRRKLLGKLRRHMNVYPPSVEQLVEANRNMHMKEALDKVILNYDALSYDDLYKSSLLDYQSLDESFGDEAQEFYDLFESSYNFDAYENVVSLLKKGKVVLAKRRLLELVNEAVQPAIYAYVVVFFKEIIGDCDVLNPSEENVKTMEKNEKAIGAAVQLLKRANFMEPATNFLLGMLKRYNIGNCSKFMSGSWKDDLINVVNVARDRGIINLEEYILDGIDCNTNWVSKKCGLGIQNKIEYLKEITKYSLYEIALSISSEEYFHVNALRGLFQVLCQVEFPEALYSKGAVLLQNGIGTTIEGNIENAMEYLNRAASVGHEGAKFLLGNLLFNENICCRFKKDEINCYVRKLELYIKSSDNSCILNEKNIDKVAHCLAVEYYSKMSYLLDSNIQKAQNILISRNLHKELRNLSKLK